LRNRALRFSKGKDVSDTADEDEEADAEMDADVVPDSDAPGHPISSTSASRPRLSSKKKKKGKQRALDHAEEDTGENGDPDDDEVNDDAKLHYITGPLPQQGQEEARELGESTKLKADALAKKYRKSPHAIMLAAGLTVRNAHQRKNFANKHKRWYSHYNPIPPGSESLVFFPLSTSHLCIKFIVSFEDYRQQLHSAYKQFQVDNPPDDKESYARACQPIHDLCEELDKPVDDSDKSVVGLMQSYKKQFTNLVCSLTIYLLELPLMLVVQSASLWNMHQILVVGGMAYAGNDPIAKQSATTFGGNAAIKNFMEANKLDIRKWLAHLTTVAELVVPYLTLQILLSTD
jgi:hypothetical protein